jgi:hypothetical protein
MSLLKIVRKTLFEEVRKGHFNRPALTVVAGIAGLIWIHRYTAWLKKKALLAKRAGKSADANTKKKSEKDKYPSSGSYGHSHGHFHGHDDEVDLKFWEHMRRLLPIIIPRFLGKETAYIFILGVLLTVRTFLSSNC